MKTAEPSNKDYLTAIFLCALWWIVITVVLFMFSQTKLWATLYSVLFLVIAFVVVAGVYGLQLFRGWVEARWTKKENFFRKLAETFVGWVGLIVGWVVEIGIIVFFLGGAFYLLSVQSCTTKECFISHAQSCVKQDLTLDESYAVVRYSTSADCVFTKTIVGMKPDEPSVMQRLLLNKTMTCAYARDDFNPEWVESLINGIDDCQGGLKDSVGDLTLLLP